MPTFDFKCSKCDHLFEEIVLPGEDFPRFCIKCNAPVKKVLTGSPGFIFKGSGFPTNDLRMAKDCKDMVKGKSV